MCFRRIFNNVKMLPVCCLLVTLLLNSKQKDDLIFIITLYKYRTKTKWLNTKMLIKSGYF